MDRVRTCIFAATKDRDDPEPLLDFIDGLQAALGLIPVKHRKAAVIDFETEWESAAIEIKIWYDRPPTKAEIKAEEDGARERIESRTRAHREQELALLAELKRKYEGA